MVALLGSPAHGDSRRPRLRPVPLHAAVEKIGVGADPRLERVAAVEVLPAGERSGGEQSRVDRRELDRLEAPSRLHVEEVVVKAVEADLPRDEVPLGGFEKESQRGRHATGRVGPRRPAAFSADRVGGQAEADGGHAREGGGRRAVRNQSGGRVGEVPEPAEGPLLEVIEEGVGRRVARDRRGRRDPCGSGPAGGQEKTDGGEQPRAAAANLTAHHSRIGSNGRRETRHGPRCPCRAGFDEKLLRSSRSRRAERAACCTGS